MPSLQTSSSPEILVSIDIGGNQHSIAPLACISITPFNH